MPSPGVIEHLQPFLDAYGEVAKAFPIRGNLVPDAHLAVLLRQHGVRTLYTRDADFRKIVEFPRTAWAWLRPSSSFSVRRRVMLTLHALCILLIIFYCTTPD